MLMVICKHHFHQHQQKIGGKKINLLVILGQVIIPNLNIEEVEWITKARMFSLIKNDEIKTKPTAPSDLTCKIINILMQTQMEEPTSEDIFSEEVSNSTIVHKKIERFQLAPDLTRSTNEIKKLVMV